MSKARMRYLVSATFIVLDLSLPLGGLADVFNLPAGVKSLEFVTVGDAGNAADPRQMVNDHTSGYGSVPYVYQIGKYEVTTSQYAQFLNNVASTGDPYGLYNPAMADPSWPASVGCGIIRTQIAGVYSYSVIAGRENFPVNYVSWGDAARFVNWLSNGQPTGTEGSGTTESGSYAINGALSLAALMQVGREPTGLYRLATENEWYKAAYYKGGSSNSGYWLYPTKNDSIPSQTLSSSGTNNANHGENGYADPVNHLTVAGLFAGSPGPYGTFDQGGNVFEWEETVFDSTDRVIRGGAYSHGYSSLWAVDRLYEPPVSEGSNIGIRVVAVPEPAEGAIFAFGILLLRRRRRK